MRPGHTAARPDCPADRRSTAPPELVASAKDSIGITIDVEVVDPDTLERSVGKLQRVIDQRDAR